jgi:hypothetical protein
MIMAGQSREVVYFYRAFVYPLNFPLFDKTLPIKKRGGTDTMLV